MKVFKLILYVVFLVFAYSCENDDEPEQDDIIAAWSLKSIEKDGIETPATGCELSQLITFNSDSTGNDYFPENDENEPCDFETLQFSWSRDGDQLMLDSVEEGNFLIQIFTLTNTELQISVLENNGIPTPDSKVFKYEK